MDPPNQPGPRSPIYQWAVLVFSALVIVMALIIANRFLGQLAGQPGSVTAGLTAAQQVLGAAAPRAPAASTLPGLAGSPTATASPTLTPSATGTTTPTATATASPTKTPDVKVYDAKRLHQLLAEAQTTYGSQASGFDANVVLAAGRLAAVQIPPNGTFSFDQVVGPFTDATGYQPITGTNTLTTTATISTTRDGITQVSTTFFQAAFWSGLKIVEHYNHPVWQDRFAAGSQRQAGLDALVDQYGKDLKVQNDTPDWIRIDTQVSSGAVTVRLIGVDPGWSVHVDPISTSHKTAPAPAAVERVDQSLPPGARLQVRPAVDGFDQSIHRIVTGTSGIIDDYQLNVHYSAQAALFLVGPTATATATATPLAEATSTPPATPTTIAGSGRSIFNPSDYQLPDGRIRVPPLVGLAENDAQSEITSVGLSTTYVNRQGPGDVPQNILQTVPIGAVLSQQPAPGTIVERGTTVHLAVRNK